MTPRPPANGTAPLEAPGEYQRLDTEAARSLADVVRLAAHTCDTTAAVMTLVDESRPSFKASYGVNVHETEPDLPFCAHTILESDSLVVPDAREDARFRDHVRVVRSPGIRFYAGVPLISADGRAVGTLAVLDVRPRHPTAEQIQSLRMLGGLVVAQLGWRRRVVEHAERALAAESSVQVHAARHRVMLDSALDAIVMMDAAGRVTDVNASAEQLFGFTRVEAVGRLMAEAIIPPEGRDQHARGLARYLTTGETVILGRRVQVTAMRRDGSRFPIELTVQRLGVDGPPAFVGFIRDITEQVRATEALRTSTERYREQRRAMTRLIQDERLYHGDLADALRQITETVAQTLTVARVSVWESVDAHSRIRCLDLYESRTGQHSQGAEISVAEAPAYFEALSRMEVLAVSDARNDPRTAELARDYVLPHDISSMLDATVHRRGGLHGVLCLEHVGPARAWTAEEETFAVAAANLVSLALEGLQRRHAQDALVAQTTILTAVTESLAAYVEQGDWRQAFSRLLRCALEFTESEYGFVGVVVDGRELRVLAHEGLVWDAVVNRDFYDRAQRQYLDQGYVTFHSFDNLFGRAITTGHVVIANDPDGDPRASGRPAGHPPMTSFLGVPIRGRDEVTGLIALANRPNGYGPEEARRIEALVQHAGALCESYRQRERARVRDEERVRTEAALRASDERLRLLARATNDAVWDRDLQNNTLVVPEGFRKLFADDGEHAQVTQESWLARVHPDDRARIETSLRAALEGGASSWSEEYRFLRADGRYATILDRGYVLRHDENRAVRMVGAMMDITERKQLEAQFRQAQKLEAVGQLAGGVAHDFNNLLTVIKGHVSLLLGEGDHPPDTADSILQISQAAERAAGLTRQLLAFSRKQVLQTTNLDMNEVVGRIMLLLQRLLGEHVRLDIEYSRTPALVRADASMMEQLILNLALNARDAMPDGGRLFLRTTTERLGGDAVAVHPDARSGVFVRVRISDTGAGILPDALPHIFEPFFTTKGPERGTGLGLATVHGIVKQHLGWVTVESIVGTGTTFDVYLPMIADRDGVTKTTEVEDAAEGRGETILIVEDDTAVRRLARLLLERRGYVVLEAQSGPAALAVWHGRSGPIDILVTDMVMPDEMSGLELAARLRREQPDLCVVVTSGYSVDLAGTEVSRNANVKFLAKPYAVDQLLRVVRASLDAR